MKIKNLIRDKYFKQEFISFAKFAKDYKSSRNVEKAYEQWINKNNYEKRT